MGNVHLQAIFIPFVGILGNEFNRVALIAIGSLWWGAMSVGFGFAANLAQVKHSKPSSLHQV